jgi:hypothetical protein
MKSIFKKANITDRLPNKEGWYACGGKMGMHGFKFDNQQNWDLEELQEMHIKYWLEEIEIEDDLDINDIFELLPIFKDKDYTLSDKISIIINKHDKGIFEDNVDHEGVINDVKLLIETELKEKDGNSLA